MKLVLSKWTADRVEEGLAPQEAAQRALYYLKTRLNGHGGMILVDCKGQNRHRPQHPPHGVGLCSEDARSSGIEFKTSTS